MIDCRWPLTSGDYLLVVIDEYSITKLTTMKSAIPVLDKTFAPFSIPLKVESDNGSTFDCSKFWKICKIFMVYSSPHYTYPKGNGLVEKFNRIIGKVLCTTTI